MKKISTIITIASLTCAFPALAEGDHKQVNQGFLDAAAQYEAKAEHAKANGNRHNAAIFKKLAAIKREAAVHQGNYDWSKYHALQGELNHKNKNPHDQKHAPNKGFLDAAKNYKELAKKSRAEGDHRRAHIYNRMAAIKMKAAHAKGEFDWSEYHELNAKLNQSPKENTAHNNQHGKTPDNNQSGKLIADAQKHAALANKSSADGDNYASQIHSRLAAILIDAAARENDGKEIDWTEFKKLNEMLEQHQ